MGGGGVGKMRANACKGGGRVLAMSAHAFLALKDLQFGVVLMEGFDRDRQEQFSFNLVTFVQKVPHCIS